MYSSKTHYLLMKRQPYTNRKIARSTIKDETRPDSCCKTEEFNTKTSFQKPQTKSNVNSLQGKGINPLKSGHSQKEYFLKRNKYPILETSINELEHSGALSHSDYINKKKFRHLFLDSNISPPDEENHLSTSASTSSTPTALYTKNQFVSYTSTKHDELLNVRDVNDKCNNITFKQFKVCP